MIAGINLEQKEGFLRPVASLISCCTAGFINRVTGADKVTEQAHSELTEEEMYRTMEDALCARKPSEHGECAN